MTLAVLVKRRENPISYAARVPDRSLETSVYRWQPSHWYIKGLFSGQALEFSEKTKLLNYE